MRSDREREVNQAMISRRRFVKDTAIVGAGITAFPFVFVRPSQAAWAKKTIVHPNVDNLRVVGITDPGMTSDLEPSASWPRQNELINSKAVWENLDRLACTLAKTGDPGQAWRTIFVRPPQKSWSETVVAIKTNHIGVQHTRSAVMARVCHALTDVIGVKATNIHIYDACHGRNMSRDTPFSGLPEGCRIEDQWGASNAYTQVSKPWRGGEDKSECLKYLVNGTVDILINMAMCKGHSSRFGGFTMTLKNHFGTFSPSYGHWVGSGDYLMGINQTPEILGPMDPGSGKVLYPRQQLCMVDALWASEEGPTCGPSHQPNFLAMGVMSPIVDYIVATQFRGERMGWKPDMEATRRMLTDFGYSESDLPNGGDIVAPS
ncbi:MAG: hypothetical protein QG552_3450 [Thermodesulfobacteriota bacterium]|nr:hypothetical protein [Thermodesulfobacteriota bacterium]